MRKFVKGCLITSAIFAGIGIICLMIAGIFGGRGIYREIVENGYNGRFTHISPFWSSEKLIINNREISGKSGYSDTLDAAKIDSLDIKAGACSFTIEERSDNENIYELYISGYGECEYYVDGSTLTITGFDEYNLSNNKRHFFNFFDMGFWENNKIILSIPKNSQFEDADFKIGAGTAQIDRIKASVITGEIGAGELKIDELYAENMRVNVGTGRASFTQAQVDELKMEINVGEGIYQGTVVGNMDVVCSVGRTRIKLDQSISDFNYEIECGIGSVSIDRNQYTALGYTKEIDNGADKDCSLNCSIGSIDLEFRE